MVDSDSSFASYSHTSHRGAGWMNKPTKIRCIDQLSHKPSLTSFQFKDDPFHARVPELLCSDPFTDISNPSRRGLANNVHFLIIRDMHDAVAAQRITSDGMELLYEYHALKKLHRVKLIIAGNGVDEDTTRTTSVSIEGAWVKAQSEALDDLRLIVEAAIYGTK
jgi:hypothetical protein